MTEKSIVQELARWIDNREYPYQVPNAFIYGWESDYWALDVDGIAKEFEIKISRSDYFSDAKKEKHKSDNCANYFYYVCPKDLIKKEEVDKRYGLIYIWETGHLSVEKKPRRLHDHRFNNWQLLANKMYFRWRSIWCQKYLEKQITVSEFREGFNLDLKSNEHLASGIPKSMDEFAKQQAIAFANYIAFNHKPHDIDTWDGGRINTHELYDEFIHQEPNQ
jgi:hypothetical protein